MGMILIYGLIVLIVFLGIAVGLFIYSKKSKSKIGLAISVTMMALVVLALSVNIIDEFGISKDDVVSDLKHIKIELKDDFQVIDNNVTGMPERIQETEIQISKGDKDRIINEIKKSTNFKSFTNGREPSGGEDAAQYEIGGEPCNFEYSGFYTREIYAKIDNFPTRIQLSICERDNVVKYRRVED